MGASSLIQDALITVLISSLSETVESSPFKMNSSVLCSLSLLETMGFHALFELKSCQRFDREGKMLFLQNRTLERKERENDIGNVILILGSKALFGDCHCKWFFIF